MAIADDQNAELTIHPGDRWLVYAVVDRGEVLESNGVTAIVHRKSASY
jgi:hypothetical protein